MQTRSTRRSNDQQGSQLGGNRERFDTFTSANTAERRPNSRQTNGLAAAGDEVWSILILLGMTRND